MLESEPGEKVYPKRRSQTSIHHKVEMKSGLPYFILVDAEKKRELGGKSFSFEAVPSLNTYARMLVAMTPSID